MSDLQRAQYAQLISENRGKYAYKSDALSVAQLFDFVKRYDEEFKPKSVNPALLNEDGTPRRRGRRLTMATQRGIIKMICI